MAKRRLTTAEIYAKAETLCAMIAEVVPSSELEIENSPLHMTIGYKQRCVGVNIAGEIYWGKKELDEIKNNFRLFGPFDMRSVAKRNLIILNFLKRQDGFPDPIAWGVSQLIFQSNLPRIIQIDKSDLFYPLISNPANGRSVTPIIHGFGWHATEWWELWQKRVRVNRSLKHAEAASWLAGA